MMGEGITLAHQEFISDDRERDGVDFPSSQLFADDAIFAEPDIGRRKEAVIAFWEYVCRSLLGPTSASVEKAKLEGAWGTSHIILGFEMNVDELTNKLPAAKIEDAWQFFRAPMFATGNRAITVKKAQELRGLVNFWS